MLAGSQKNTKSANLLEARFISGPPTLQVHSTFNNHLHKNKKNKNKNKTYRPYSKIVAELIFIYVPDN